ncbi:MAG TPA: hypothetical protein VN936_05830 [Candidatus Acidoferrum sp.]|nr:hypothetical protein [Candidatus Acidoferrum sp.]
MVRKTAPALDQWSLSGRQHDGVRDRTFRIEFLEPGVQAFSFTFG